MNIRPLVISETVYCYDLLSQPIEDFLLCPVVRFWWASKENNSEAEEVSKDFEVFIYVIIKFTRSILPKLWNFCEVHYCT